VSLARVPLLPRSNRRDSSISQVMRLWLVATFCSPLSNGGIPMSAVVDPQKCNGCGGCVGACAVGAIEIESGLAEVDPEVCDDCGSCLTACPKQAISMS